MKMNEMKDEDDEDEKEFERTLKMWDEGGDEEDDCPSS